jgi:hypothetical protein
MDGLLHFDDLSAGRAVDQLPEHLGGLFNRLVAAGAPELDVRHGRLRGCGGLAQD